MHRAVLFSFALLFLLPTAQGAQPDSEPFLPSPKDAGYRMEGFLVWGGSIIQVGGKYHLFASRWPEGTGEPTHLVTGIQVGEHSWCHVKAIAAPE